MSTFVPCPVCRRHIRTSEASCRFCGGDVSAQSGAAGMRTVAILSAAALTLVACKDSAPPAQPEPVPTASASSAQATSPTAAPSSAPVASASASAAPIASAPESASAAASVGPPPTAPVPTPVRPMAMRYGMAPRGGPPPRPTGGDKSGDKK